MSATSTAELTPSNIKPSKLKYFTPWTDQTVDLSDLSRVDHLVPHSPVGEIVQDLHIVVQIQPRTHALDDADYKGPTRQHKLNHTKSGLDDLSALEGIDRIELPEV